MIYLLVKSPKEIRLLICYATLILLAGMFFPTSSNSPNGLWWILQQEGATGRYFFLLHVALFAGLTWIIFSGSHIILKTTATFAILTACLVGVPRDFKYPPLADLHYKDYANRFVHMAKGDKLRIPINPGPNWDITLIRK
jgi:hypothetical protein